MPWSLKGAFEGAFKGNRLPEDVRGVLDLERGERLLAYAPTRGGSYVVSTSTALHLPAVRAEGGTDPAFVRLPWERIERASWRDGWLHIHEPDGTTEHHVRLTEPRSVPETVRERVTSTIVVDRRVRLPGGGRVRITGRRRPDGNELRWAFVFEAGLDPADPGLRAQAEQLLEDLRRQTGL